MKNKGILFYQWTKEKLFLYDYFFLSFEPDEFNI